MAYFSLRMVVFSLRMIFITLLLTHSVAIFSQETTINQLSSIEDCVKYIGSTTDSIDFITFDEKLATAIKSERTIGVIEKHREELPIEKLPSSLKAIFEIYSKTGMPGYLEEFQSNYPSFEDDELIKTEMKLSEQYLELPKQIDGKKDQFHDYIKNSAPRDNAYLMLVKSLENSIRNEDWSTILNTAKSFLPEFGKDEPKLNSLIKIAGSPKEAGIVKKCEYSLSSDVDEYNPVLAIDNQAIYFCRRVGNKEKVFASTYENGVWKKPEAIAALNSGGDKAPLSISADGNELIIFDGGKIKSCKLGNEGWEKPQNFSSVINSSKWQGGTTLSSSGNIIIYSASRNDVVGISDRQNTDLFVSRKSADGTWSVPKNLGVQINSTFAERTPFLHPDMKTLYFSSEGHGGLGGLDVYKATRLDESWQNWSHPVNMGKMINTADDDWGYIISTDGEMAYFATNKRGEDQQDIFTVSVPKDFKPEKVSTISGVLTNSKGEPLDASIIIDDLELNKVVTTVTSNPATGEFFIVLPDTKLYGYTVEKDGYFPVSGNLDLRITNAIQNIERKIQMAALEEIVEKKLSLPVENLFFETSKAIIQSTSYSGLNRLAELIKKNNFKLVLEGHTDSAGSDSYNLNLSQKRADAVKAYLVSRGCSDSVIKAVGVGEAKPVADNSTDEGKAENRRVELKLRQ